jgi:hypothetical protein
MVRIYGKQNLQLWLKNFGFFNPWILSKIKIWKKLGYFPIKKLEAFVLLADSFTAAWRCGKVGFV